MVVADGISYPSQDSGPLVESYQLLQILELEILLFPSKNTLKDKIGQKVPTCRIPLLTGHRS